MSRRLVLLSGLLLALLTSALAVSDDVKTKGLTPAEKRKAKDELLASKLKIVEAAQRERKDTMGLKNMTSDIVEEAPEAELWNGDADVSTVGACEHDIDLFCAKVEPGEGRLAGCLSEQLEAQAAGDTVGRAVSIGCYEELSAFMLDRATNINKDVPLARACRDDVKKHCSKKKYDRDNAADVLDCLRRLPKKKLSDKCARRVFEEEAEEAKDWRVDPGLHRKCALDVRQLCGDADTEQEGAVTQCLLERIGQVSGPCVEELKRVEKQRAEDVRLDRTLFRACSADVRRFCKDEEWGDGKMEDCLQDHRHKEEFSQRCRQALEARMARESSDYQLNYGLREYCEEDIKRLCKKERDAIELREGFAADAQVITCLETKRDKIRGERCRKEIQRQMEHEAEDIRFDHELAKACHSDVRQHCKDVVPGSARVIGCLGDHRADLSKGCAAKLFEHDQRLAEDIDFKYPLRRACVVEISIFCKDVPHGHARVVRCLQDNMEDEDMSHECRAEVQKDQLLGSRDFRLNYRFFKACSADLSQLCAAEVKSCSGPGQECQGVVAGCLRDRLDDVQGEECRDEVFHVLRMQVGDYQADPQLAAACQGDISMHCKAVAEAGGRVHDCLRQHWELLSSGCRDQERKLSILQARDVRLRPRLRTACSEEISVFCKDVQPGRGRLYRCLVDNVGKGGFGVECKQVVLDSTAASQADYRLDYAIGAACRADVDSQCGAEKQQLLARQGRGVVLQCLVANYKALADGCQNEVSRGARSALWTYKEGAPLTEVCDADVKARCPSLPRMESGHFRVGAVGQCLSIQVTQGGAEPLSPGCKELVLAAAPRDARAVFDSSMSLEAAATKVAQIAHAAGLSSASGPAGGIGAITLTGWVAFVAVCALVAVVLGMLGFAVWRYFGAPGPQRHRYSTVVVKEGDV